MKKIPTIGTGVSAMGCFRGETGIHDFSAKSDVNGENANARL